MSGLVELRALAEAATAKCRQAHHEYGDVIRCQQCHSAEEAGRNYRSAVSPDVVLGLLDEVEALRATVAAVEVVCDIVDGTGALHRDVRAKLEAAAAKVAETLTPEMVSRVEAAWQTQVIGDGPGVPLRGLATLTDAHPSATEAPQSAQDAAEAPESHHDRDEGWEAEK